MKIKKEIQTVQAKQKLLYVEAKKLITSRPPIVRLSHAAVSASTSQKKAYQPIKIQTDILTRDSVLKFPTKLPTKTLVR